MNFKPIYVLVIAFGIGLVLSACQKKTENTSTITDTLSVETPAKDSAEAPASSIEDKSQRKSPPDSVKANVGNVQLQINYSQPAVRGRKIWGELVPFGEVWRTGANEATVFSTNKDIMVEGQKLPAGRYALFSIPQENEWTIIFSNNADQWGAFKYSEAEDALRLQVTPETISENVENLTFQIASPEEHMADVILEWEKIRVPIHIREVF